MKKVILGIEGMTCSACSNGLEKYLNKQEGINYATVNLVMATASVEYEDNLSIDDLGKFVKEAGFKSLGVANLNKKKKKSFVPFIIYGILAMVLMYISMATMLKLPIFTKLDMNKYPINYSTSLLLITIPFLIYGFDIIKSGIKNLIHKMPNMDTLVTIGVFSSFLYSLFGTIMVILGKTEYVHNLYFESTAFVIYFIKLGRFIDKNSKEKTTDAIKELVTMTPKSAKIKTEDGFKKVTIDEIKKGDILICFAGEKIAVDGVIVKGTTHLDESFITGESKPIAKKENDKVIAGSINYDGVIEYKAQKIGKESTISEIVNLVIEATNTKAPISLLADKISSFFVPVVIILASLTFLISLFFKIPFNTSLIRFVTVLVVACPCALGLATPLAIVIAEGISAKNGILIKTSETFEIANKIDTIVFDKTGTLTNGNLKISKLYNYSNLSDNKLLEILGKIEEKSIHPIAKGVINSLKEKGIKVKGFDNIENLSGFGIKAIDSNDTYYACNSKLIDKLGINNIYLGDEEKLAKIGNSIIYIVKNNEILGLVGVKDIIRNEASKLIGKLKEKNIEIIMLTGDNKETANEIGKELGISNIIANVLPKEKSEVIKKLKNEGKSVIMVGDGINDAPSLSLADIAISISSGTDIATDTADVILMNNNLMKILDLIKLSKVTLKNIKQNLFWAFLYNSCMIPIAMGIFSKIGLEINPMIACVSMILSSLFVIFNALRLKKIKLY